MNDIHIGFTGTQHAPTNVQLLNAIKTIHNIAQNHYSPKLHHGSCIGSDEAIHNYFLACQCINCLVERIELIVHPGLTGHKRAECPGAIEYREAKSPLDRNHDMVDETAYLVATPGQNEEVLRSGTWAAIRYARRLGRPIVICYPDGRIDDGR